MTRRTLKLEIVGLLLAGPGVTGVSCGGKTADVVRPDVRTGAGALGEIECAAAQQSTAPLVVDWSSQQRVDLEVAMKRGTVALRYGCNEVEILPRCEVPGSYAFVGVTRKEEVVTVSTLDELKASLPVGAARLAAEVAGESKLDLAMVLVGKASSGWAALSRDDLPEECATATHVVRATTVGAFALARGSEGRVVATAEAFGAGAGASSVREVDRLTRDGDLNACQQSKRDAAEAPQGCGSSIRLQLEPILESPVVSKAPPPVTVAACPTGTAMADGACRDASKPHICAPHDEADCAKQCDAGDLDSCYHLGRLRIDWTPTGLSGSPQQVGAQPLLERACEGDVNESCVALGELYLGQSAGSGLAQQRQAMSAAAALWTNACEAGSGRGCGLLAYLSSPAGPLADPAQHFPAASRACDLGDGLGCRLQANALIKGYGAQADVDGAYVVLERSCRAADVASCRRLAVARYSGTDQSISPTINGVPTDKAAAVRFGLRTCRLDPDACGIDRTIAFGSQPLAQQFRADMCSAGHQPMCD